MKTEDIVQEPTVKIKPITRNIYSKSVIKKDSQFVECDEGFVGDCSGDGDCCNQNWIGDGNPDCIDQIYGCDLTCYENDGGDCGDDLLGCLDIMACNFNSEATLDNGSCWYPNIGCDCDDGQGAIADECGMCNGPGSIYECGCDKCCNMLLEGNLDFDQGSSDITGFYQDGREFAVVGLMGYDAAAFVDITDPKNPFEVGRIEGSPSIWRDIKYWNYHVYIGTEAQDGVKVVSVENPDNPYLVNIISDFSSSHNIHIDSDGYLYVIGAGGHDLWIYELTDHPANPVLVGTWDGEYFHDIEVYNNKLYGAAIYSGYFYILDVSDKTNPNTILNHYTGLNGVSTHDCAVTYDENYLITADETSGGHIKIWDISDYDNINIISEYMTDPHHSVHNVYIRPETNLVIMSYYVDGTRILDITDPINPVEVGYYDTSVQTGLFDGNWGSYAYLPSGYIISSDQWNGLFIFNTPLTDSEMTWSECVEVEDIYGCTNPEACNYNADATEDDGICEFPDGNYDCDGNCILEIDICNVCGGDGTSCMADYSIDLHEGANLISFYTLPENMSVTNIIGDAAGNIYGIIGEGVNAAYINDHWIGSIIEIRLESGYWILVEDTDVSLSGSGTSYDPNRVYNLHAGANLISYSSFDSYSLSNAIPDDVENQFIGILSEGVSAINTENGWIGSLTHFSNGKGYWVIVSEDLSFSYESGSMTRTKIKPYIESHPSGNEFNVMQSTNQAFYFVDDIFLEAGVIAEGDWLLSFKENVLTGIRQWQGTMIDIPAMGIGDNTETKDYFIDGDIPTFKLLKESTGELITLEGDIPSWSANGIYILSSLTEIQSIPTKFSLESAYPNPFNPTTTLSFSLPIESEVSLSIYNLQGRLVSTLISGSMDAGKADKDNY